MSGAELDVLLGQEARLVLVAFWTPSCEPCRELRAQLSGFDTDVAAIVAVNAEADPEAAAEHQVHVFPTLAFFKGGRELRRLRGGALPASTLRLLT